MSQIKWQAKLTGKLFRASVSREANKQEAIIALYTDDDQAVLPNWNIYCNGEVIDKDFNSFWKLVKDTLMEYQPYIKLDFQDYLVTRGPYQVVGKLKGFLYSSNEGAAVDASGKYYLHLYLKLPIDESIPEEIDDITITIKGKQLPADKYSYGYCNQIASKDTPCDFLTYLKVVGLAGNDKGLVQEVVGFLSYQKVAHINTVVFYWEIKNYI